MLDMAGKQIIPACIEYMRTLSETIAAKTAAGFMLAKVETDLLTKINELTTAAYEALNWLTEETVKVKNVTSIAEQATYYHDKVLTVMGELRDACDRLEALVPADYWPIPTYADLLFSV